MKIGVLADDLTGAGDAALAFERAGFRTEIFLWPPSGQRSRADVWVISTESRGLSDEEAGKRVRRAAGLFRQWRASFVYKKIDSTLRGPVRAELDAFRLATGNPERVPVVPAFPAAGRTVEGGRLRLEGVPLHRTAFGRDPRHPLRTDRVADIVGDGFWIPDVKDEKVLRRVAAEAIKGKVRSAVGSAGFAAALARVLAGNRHPGESRGPGSKAGSKKPFQTLDAGLRRHDGIKRPPVLLVSGSAHPKSRAQLGAIHSLENVFVVSVPAQRGDPREVLRSLIRKAVREARRYGIRRFAVTGGETAAALAGALNVRRWRVTAEVDRGVPLTVSSGVRDQSWWVTKPGGFGREGVWKRAIHLLAKTR